MANLNLTRAQRQVRKAFEAAQCAGRPFYWLIESAPDYRVIGCSDGPDMVIGA